MNKTYDDSNWREEYKAYTSNKNYLELLENGPKSLSQSWILGALYNNWRKMKGYKYPEPPDCQSSFKEFNEIVKEGFEHKEQEFTPENDPYGGY